MLVRRSIGRIKKEKMRKYISVSLVYFKSWRIDWMPRELETIFFSYLGFYAAPIPFISKQSNKASAVQSFGMDAGS